MLFTTHKVSRARDADHIVVLSHGRIVEEGTHAALLARRGAYAGLLRMGDGLSEDEASAVVDQVAGIEEDDLPTLHDLVVAELVEVIGIGTDLESVFRFISSKEGEKTMAEAKLNQTHKDLLQYFSSMILDPDGHKRWMEEIRDDLKN